MFRIRKMRGEEVGGKKDDKRGETHPQTDTPTPTPIRRTYPSLPL